MTIDRELVLIRGNHDGYPGPEGGPGSFGLLADLLGAPMVEECEVETDEGRLLVLHGDQFDQTLNLTWVGDVADWCYNRVQRTSRVAARWLKHRAKYLTGVVAGVMRGATARAAKGGYAGVVTGHTHYSDDGYMDGLRFLNTGCWVDWPCTAIEVSDGQARLVTWGEDMLSSRRQMALAAD